MLKQQNFTISFSWVFVRLLFFFFSFGFLDVILFQSTGEMCSHKNLCSHSSHRVKPLRAQFSCRLKTSTRANTVLRHIFCIWRGAIFNVTVRERETSPISLLQNDEQQYIFNITRGRLLPTITSTWENIEFTCFIN